MCGRGWVAVVLAFVLLPAAAQAQAENEVLPSPRIVLVGGAVTTALDSLSGAGDGSMIGLRLDLPLSRRTILEPSLERLALDGDPQAQVRWHVDFGIRAEIAVGPVRPFMGAALGALLWPGDDRPATGDFVAATYGGLAGLRYDVSDRIGLRAELRRRWLDGLDSSTTTYGAGLSWRF